MNSFFIITKKTNGGFCYLNNLNFLKGIEIFKNSIKKKNKSSVILGLKEKDKRIILEYNLKEGVKLLNNNLIKNEQIEVIKKEFNII